MPELETTKAPEQNTEQKPEEPLTPKKKRAMLEYMGIMFAVAFLFVAISLFIKMMDMRGEMEAANTGARENIARLQQDLDTAKEENEALQQSLEAVQSEVSEAKAQIDEANANAAQAEKARDQLQEALDAVNEKMDVLTRENAAADLLLSAQAALEQGDETAFVQHMEALAPYADALSEAGSRLYQELQKELPNE